MTTAREADEAEQMLSLISQYKQKLLNDCINRVIDSPVLHSVEERNDFKKQIDEVIDDLFHAAKRHYSKVVSQYDNAELQVHERSESTYISTNGRA